MEAKKIISWLILLFGEALIIAGFILFKGELKDNILVLNIIISSVIYGLFFVDILIPWINFNDKSQRRVGSLGVRWFVTWLYAIVAVALMFIANIHLHLIFSTQLLIHCILLFFIFMGLLASLHSQSKVNEVFHTDTANRNGILEMKKSMSALKNVIAETADLPALFIERVNILEENLRFISPSQDSEAHKLENLFVEAINAIHFALTNYSLNEQQIENNLKKCERLYKNRKQIHSN